MEVCSKTTCLGAAAGNGHGDDDRLRLRHAVGGESVLHGLQDGLHVDRPLNQSVQNISDHVLQSLVRQLLQQTHDPVNCFFLHAVKEEFLHALDVTFQQKRNHTQNQLLN